MKGKVIKKKFSLNKQTVANLSRENMVNLKGGTIETAFSDCICTGPISECICPQTVACAVSDNGCETEWLGQSCL